MSMVFHVQQGRLAESMCYTPLHKAIKSSGPGLQRARRDALHPVGGLAFPRLLLHGCRAAGARSAHALGTPGVLQVC